MYNRYIRQDDGSYTRVTEPEAPARGRGLPRRRAVHRPIRRPIKNRNGLAPMDRSHPPPAGNSPSPFRPFPAARRVSPGICGGCWTSFIWTVWTPEDLLLLGLLYFLFREKADEELLVALGLLLIL